MFWGAYGASKGPAFIRNAIYKWLISDGGMKSDVAHDHLNKYLIQKNPSFGDGKPWFQHDKFWLVDDLFYLGSHNIYYCNLTEFGLICEDQDHRGSVNNIIEYIKDNYWTQKWNHAVTPGII